MVVWKLIRSFPSWVFPLAMGIILILLPYAGLEYALSRQIQLSLILALVVSGLNLGLGYAGQLALGQAAMYAAGAYAAAVLSKSYTTDVVVQLIVGGLAALVVGVATGIPGLRLGAWSLAMTSFFLVLLIPDLAEMFEGTTGGGRGFSGIQGGTLFGEKLTTNGVYILIAAVTVLWFAVFRNLVVSRHGVAFRVLKESPVLAGSLGISVFRMKLLGYAIGAVPAGLGGVLFANLDLYLSPESFGFTLATASLAASILGGSASVYGAAVGAFIVQFGTDRSSNYKEYSLIVFGALLIIGGVAIRGGLAGISRKLVARLDRRLAGERLHSSAAVFDDVPLADLPGGHLAVTGVLKAFGGNRAVDGVTLQARPGRVTALIGPNGSGKTTLLNLICGFYRLDEGDIKLGGDRLDKLAPDAIARAGIARTFQTPAIPEGVTVQEAIIAGRYATAPATMLGSIFRTPRFRSIQREDLVLAHDMMCLAGMEHLAGVEAASLPLGMRRMLEVARALMGEPKVLLLDEAASGLDEGEVERLGMLIRRLRDAGGTVVLVEHNFRLVLSLADDIYVLARGSLLASGTPEEIETNPLVLDEYLGVEAELDALVEDESLGEPVKGQSS